MSDPVLHVSMLMIRHCDQCPSGSGMTLDLFIGDFYVQDIGLVSILGCVQRSERPATNEPL